MKKLLIFSYILLSISLNAYAQDNTPNSLNIYYINGKLSLGPDSPQSFSQIFVFDTIPGVDARNIKLDTSRVKNFANPSEDGHLKHITIHYDKNKITITNKKDSKDVVEIWGCKDSPFFALDQAYCNNTHPSSDADLTEPPYPYFSNSIKFPFPTPDSIRLKKERKQRIFIIDARPILNKNNNTLYKLKKTLSKNNNLNDIPDKTTITNNASPINDTSTAANPDGRTTKTTKSSFKERLVATNTLPLRSSMSVFIEGYNFDSLENLTISVAGTDYTYDKDLSNLYTETKTPAVTQPSETTKIDTGKGTNPANATALKNQPTADATKYENIYIALKTNYDAMNIGDLLELNQYKEKLNAFIAQQKKGGVNLSPEAFEWYSRIMRWSPTYLGLTPLNVSVPDNDEIAISMNIKNKNESTSRNILLGSYRGSRGIAVGLGSMIHVAKLKNHEAYTDTTGGGKFARLDKTGKSSVGLGLNVEMLYRTGSSICPAFNVGFFVPFDEDLTPFLVFGPGINIGSKNVSLGITGGAALGKINAIASQFKDRDLTGLDLTNEQLTQKVWKWGWQFGIGLRFNIATPKQ